SITPQYFWMSGSAMPPSCGNRLTWSGRLKFGPYSVDHFLLQIPRPSAITASAICLAYAGEGAVPGDAERDRGPRWGVGRSSRRCSCGGVVCGLAAADSPASTVSPCHRAGGEL